MRRERYDREMRGHRREHGGGYDRGRRRGFAYGRTPGLPGPGSFAPFGWDPMMRWGGWDPALGLVPYADAPERWGYGLPGDARYDHEYYRGSGRAPRVPPRESPTYGRGGDRALRAWARSRGYDVEHTIRPRGRGRR